MLKTGTKHIKYLYYDKLSKQCKASSCDAIYNVPDPNVAMNRFMSKLLSILNGSTEVKKYHREVQNLLHG